MVKYISIFHVIVILTLSIYFLNKSDKYEITKFLSNNDCVTYSDYPNFYIEGWDTLNNVVFWRNIIKMSPDSGILNVCDTREIIGVISCSDYRKIPIDYRDTLRKKLNINSQIYFTTGKNHFYDLTSSFPYLKRGIKIFEMENTDPFYAHVILLIESPGKSATSSVGAVGHFQLMPYVAKSMGIRIEDRNDFDKSAYAAAKLIRTICIPQAKEMINKHNIKYKETDLWFRLLVLHIYHAGAGNVRGALDKCDFNSNIIIQLWNTKYKSFGNASQNYSQIAIAAILEYEELYGCMDKN
jgi:hypothetical protein